MQLCTQRGNLLTLAERKSHFLITAPLKTKTAAETATVLRRIFCYLPETARWTVTVDNGGEFAEYQTLSEDADVQPYFCNPHSP